MHRFGEIIEPSSRALWDDDFLEYPLKITEKLSWEIQISVPTKINNLFVVETSNMIDLFKKCLLNDKVIFNKLTTVKLEIYCLEEDSYMILCYSNKNATYVQITDELHDWLINAKKIICFSSNSAASYQFGNDIIETPTFIRHLSVKPVSKSINSQLLQSPNLISNLSAAILTLSLCKSLDCLVFVVYLEAGPLDSVNTKPVLDLLKCFYFSTIQSYKLLKKLTESNMYM